MPDINCFFILGCPRSGTSLLSRMLDSHPRLSVPFESHVFKMFWNQRRFYGDLNTKENQYKLIDDILDTSILSYWSPKPSFETIKSNLTHQGFAGVVDALMSSHSSMPNTIWGEKTPGHISYWNEINQCFPNAKIVHIVRDGRDVARSLVSARFGPTSLDIAAQHWKRYIDTFEKLKVNLAPSDFIQLKYEDLISSPERTLTEICRFLEVEYTNEMAKFYSKEVYYPTDSTNMDNLNSPLIKDNSLKWKTELKQTEIQLIEQIAGSAFKQLAYSQSTSNDVLKSRPVKSNKLLSNLLWAFSRATDFQGQKEFINIRLINLRRRIIFLFKS